MSSIGKEQRIVKLRRAVHAGCAIVLAGLLTVIIRSGTAGAIVSAALHVGLETLALALGLTLISMLANGAIWAWVLRFMGSQASTGVGLAVFAGTGLASYVGSGAGALAESVVLLRRHDICAGRAALLLALASLIGFCGSVLWAPWGIALLHSPAAIRALPGLGAQGMLIAALVTAACGFGSLGMLVLLALTPRMARRSRLMRVVSGSSSTPLCISLRGLLMLIPCSAVAWVVGACPLWLLVNASSHAVVSLPTAVGIQSMACMAGSVTFFLPSGLGARDGAIAALLVAVAHVSLPTAAAMAILIRASDPVAKVLIVLALAALKQAQSMKSRRSGAGWWPSGSVPASNRPAGERVA